VKYALTIFPTEYTVQPDELARRAEEMGFESVWFPEHTHMPVEHSPWPGGDVLPREYSYSYDPFVALAAAGAATHELRLGTGICLIIQRDPIATAKQIATLDRVTNGRFIFGIGGGWNREEVENHGVSFKSRFAVLSERVLAMKAMWTEEKAEFHGKHVDFEPVFSYPKPVQQPHPPIIMGGDGATTFDRVIEFCDGWLPIVRGQVPPGLGDKITDIKRKAEAAGRDPASISISVFQAAPEREAVEQFERWGAERVIFNVPCRSPEEVWPVIEQCARLVR
jgi:probable F420-dependent oxidoreductase